MTNHLSWRQRLLNRFYAIPVVTEWWARRAAVRIHGATASGEAPPFTLLQKPLAECKAALITTAGVHLREQHPFDMDNPDGDASYREIPTTATQAQLTITHNYYDHADADRDINVVFPLPHFRSLAESGVIGSLARRHYGFMGHIEGEQLPLLTHRYAAEVAAKLRKEGVDFAFLTPA
ncbi:MAG: glycine/sarcosine/betaine reductase selenoprotein B family protein [Caldilinea sp.]